MGNELPGCTVTVASVDRIPTRACTVTVPASFEVIVGTPLFCRSATYELLSDHSAFAVRL